MYFTSLQPPPRGCQLVDFCLHYTHVASQFRAALGSKPRTDSVPLGRPASELAPVGCGPPQERLHVLLILDSATLRKALFPTGNSALSIRELCLPGSLREKDMLRRDEINCPVLMLLVSTSVWPLRELDDQPLKTGRQGHEHLLTHL